MDMDTPNSKQVPVEPKSNISQEQNPNLPPNGQQPAHPNENPEEQQTESPRQQSSQRTPFTNLSQIDADLALARTLQEQERAYMMLRMNHDGSDYGSWDGGSYFRDYDDDDDEDDFGDPDDDESDGEEGVHEHEFDEEEEEDAFDVNARPNTVINLDDEDDDVDEDDDEDDDEEDEDDDDEDEDAEVEFDPGEYSSDEAYARALQDAEEREMAARLFALAGINDRALSVDSHHNSVGVQDMWEEVDPDELSYEELIALGEVVGTESRGLSADTIATLPSVNYKAGSTQNGSNDSCVICRLDYEDDETLTLLSCKHSYHTECINNWLKINKVCPVCSTEVSTSGNS